MDGNLAANGYAALVEDRPEDGMFRVDRVVYTDQSIFEDEMRRIYEGTWVYLCHESQIVQPGDYYATEIGRQPVFVNRQADGTLGCFINACAHRASILTPKKQGNAKDRKSVV